MVFLFTYLYLHQFPPLLDRHASCQGKKSEKREEKERKGMEAHRVKHLTPFQSIDALTGDEEESNGKQKRTKRKKQGAGPQPSYPDNLTYGS